MFKWLLPTAQNVSIQHRKPSQYTAHTIFPNDKFSLLKRYNFTCPSIN